MNFLLECIGFPPDAQESDIVQQVLREGESVPWRGPEGEHFRLSVAGGLELRLDREKESEHWTLLPWYREEARLRVGLRDLVHVPDSPFDVLLVGWADPPIRALGEELTESGAYLGSLPTSSALDRALLRYHWALEDGSRSPAARRPCEGREARALS